MTIGADGISYYPWNHGEVLSAAGLNAAIAQSSGGPFLPLTGGTVSGATTLSAGGTFSGTFAGAHTYSGAITFSASGTSIIMSGGLWMQGGAATLGTGSNNQIVLTQGSTTSTVATINTPGTGGLAVTGSGGLLAATTNFGRGGTYTWAGTTATNAPLFVQANVAGTVSSVTEAAFLGTFSGSSANIAAPSTLIDGVNIVYSTGGAAAAAAQWNGLSINLNDSATATNDKAAGTQGSFVALQIARRATKNQGGTGLTSSTCFGQNWGIDIVNSTYSGATNTALLNGLEVNQAIQSGSSAFRRADIQLSPSNAHAVRGVYDYGVVVLLSATSGTTYRNGLTFGGGLSGTSPLGTDSALLSLNYAQDRTATANVGIDFNDATFTTAAIRAPGFTVDNAGTVRVGPGYISSTGSGLAVDARGSLGTGTPTINAGGSGWTVNDLADDAYGGTYRILTVSSGAIATISVLTQPYVNSITPPATLALTPRIGGLSGTATGGVLNGSWSSTQTTLSLNPTGRQILTNLSAATTDAAAASAGVPIGGLYNNAGVVHVRLT